MNSGRANILIYRKFITNSLNLLGLVIRRHLRLHKHTGGTHWGNGSCQAWLTLISTLTLQFEVRWQNWNMRESMVTFAPSNWKVLCLFQMPKCPEGNSSRTISHHDLIPPLAYSTYSFGRTCRCHSLS